MTDSGPMIAVCGASRCDEVTARRAEEVGRLLGEAGAILICGGLGGVMAAACGGARAAGAHTVGILPGKDRRAANPDVEIALATGLGEARNLAIVASADAMIAIAGEYGTLSEIALARKLGRTVIGLDTWQLGDRDLQAAASPAEAVKLALAAALSRD